jgi:hypothetical protein
MNRQFTVTPIALDKLTASDLRKEAMRWSEDTASAYRIIVYDADGIVALPQAAHALYIAGRLGIEWGADATWADVPSLQIGIDMWLNHAEEWEAAN